MARTELTTKEAAVLARLGRGHDAKSAARDLSISHHTVYERLRRAREKLGAANSREAARLFFASQQGSDEKLVSEFLVLSDSAAHGAFQSPTADELEWVQPDTANRLGAGSPYQASSLNFASDRFLPLRRPCERDFLASPAQRLRLIGDLAAKLAMAFVAICLAAMLVSNMVAHR